jgi:hypothetical protein
MDDLTVKESAELYSHLRDDEALCELSSMLYQLLKSIPLCQLQELKCKKSLPDLVIRIVNEVQKIEYELEQDVLNSENS